MPPGVEQFVGLLDLTNIGYKNLDTGALRFLFDFLQVRILKFFSGLFSLETTSSTLEVLLT